MKSRFNTGRTALLAIAWVLTAATTTSLHAQDSAADAPRYLVEVVIFRNLDSSKNTPERGRPVAADLADPVAGVAYPAVDANARQLNGTAQAIRNLQAYQYISHLAWIQTADDIATAPNADLGRMGLSPATVTGTANLHTRRNLHLELRLGLTATGAVISGSRRIRLNEYHYFDHPDFGVITLVTRAN